MNIANVLITGTQQQIHKTSGELKKGHDFDKITDYILVYLKLNLFVCLFSTLGVYGTGHTELFHTNYLCLHNPLLLKKKKSVWFERHEDE